MPKPLFYSYAYPEPAGFARGQGRTRQALHTIRKLHEFILPYDAVRTAEIAGRNACSILPKAPMTRPRRWRSGTGLRWKKRNQSCIRPGNVRKLTAMIFKCAAEQGAWREVQEGWRPLYGDVDQLGVSVEWHDFRTDAAVRLGPHLSSAQSGVLSESRWSRRSRRQAPSVAIICPGTCRLLRGWRTNRCRHRVRPTIIINSSTLEFSRKHLQKQFVEKRS